MSDHTALDALLFGAFGLEATYGASRFHDWTRPAFVVTALVAYGFGIVALYLGVTTERARARDTEAENPGRGSDT